MEKAQRRPTPKAGRKGTRRPDVGLMEPEADPQPRKRRFRWYRARQQKTAVARVLGLGGAVWYDFQKRTPEAPNWAQFDLKVPARLERIARRANEPLSESEIVEFEEAHKVVLPPDYRFYLRFIGNGWAGPDFGICRLGAWDDDRPWSGDDWVWLVGKLAEPFPHVNVWNPVPFDPENDEPDDDLLTSIEPEYMASKHVNGSIPLSDMGCGILTRLIVAGPEYGHVWVDQRVDWKGLFPVQRTGYSRLTFSGWYLTWLLEMERNRGLPPHA
jgi:hypothetical protein